MTKSSDTEDEIIFPQDWHDEPSLILAPYDALAAMLIWLGEMSKKPRSRGELPDPQISAEDRQRLLTAFLLLGKFDGMAGIPMFDRDGCQSRAADFFPGAKFLGNWWTLTMFGAGLLRTI